MRTAKTLVLLILLKAVVAVNPILCSKFVVETGGNYLI